MEFSTKAIHIGQEADKSTGATIVPIYQTSTYTQEDIGKHKGYEYSRTGNPTRTSLEKCLASLEDGDYGLAFASGCAATMNVMSLLKSGDHVIASDDLYGGTYRLFQRVLTKFGIKFNFIDMSNTENLSKSILPETKMVWIETPTNPLLKLCDIKAISEICKNKNLLLAVDNTFMSPYFQKPLNLGADIVVHSTTKYIGGHSDVVGGAVITSNKSIYEEIKFYQNSIGAIPGPFDCWLTLRGLKTLALRMKEHNKNAIAIANFLANHEKISKVNYPGLETHPQHELAKKQMSGFGGMISFEVKGGIEAGIKVATSTKLFSLAESLGGVESLIGHPATMTHAAIPKEKREKIGLSDGLIRISVGIEDEKDLIEDLSLALDKVIV
jgi:cystathionine gamma-synthase/cystathionine gamma-lyase